MLRAVATTGGGTGGTDSPILNDKVPSHNHTFTTDSGGAHTHTLDTGKNVNGSGNSNFGLVNTTISTNSGGVHTHSGTTNANGTASNWTPQYLDMIVCSKDAP